MPTTDAINTGAELLFHYPAWITRLSTDSNPPSTVAEVSAVLRASSVVQSAGGQVLDHAKLEWWVTSDLINRTQPTGFARMADVLLPDGPKTRVALGDYTTETESVNDDQTLTAQCQLRGYHFGDKCSGQLWWNELDSDEVETEYAPVFNPQIDGRILGNRSSKKHTTADTDAHYFVHPEALLTAEAITEGGGYTPELWNMKEAVLAMCWQLNGLETYLTNPTRADLALLDDAATLEAVALPNGEYLPYYLDRLLQPLGFNWKIDYDQPGDAEADGTFLGTYASDSEANTANPSRSIDDTYYDTTTGTIKTWNGSEWVDSGTGDDSITYDKTKPVIVIYEKGVGTERQLQFQAPGSVLDLDDSNVNNYTIARRIGDSVNQAKIIGDVERAEVTIELVKGWPTTDDSLTAADLDKSDPDSSYESKPTVWRLWVANESGDYTTTRTEITAALDLSSVFSRWVLHRREAEDPFTYQGDEAGRKQRRQIFIEYTADDGTTWAPLPDEFGQPFVMPDQIGILFTGNTPPEELIDAGDDAGVRITCVVAGDARLTGLAERQTHSVNGRVVELVLDMPQKFKKHWVQSTGSYASVLAGETAGAETADDSTAIVDYAESIRDDHEVAEMDCEFTLPGLHKLYEIGDLITEINGREVSLNQASATAPEPRYPQITKIEWRYSPAPQTILTVDRGVRRRSSTI